jgi:hypothetical protein
MNAFITGRNKNESINRLRGVEAYPVLLFHVSIVRRMNALNQMFLIKCIKAWEKRESMISQQKEAIV